MTSIQLSGRAVETAHLREWTESARVAGPVVAIVRGEPGVGKSAVLDALAELASADGFRVHRIDRTRARFDRPSPADDRPSAILVDDAHALDATALDGLLDCFQAVPHRPLLLVFAASPHFGDTPDPLAEISLQARQLHLVCLSSAAVREFAARRCGVTLDDAALRLCGELTGGNPALLIMLLGGCGRGDDLVRAEDVRAAAVGAWAPSGGDRWLAGLSAPALSLARATAVLGPDAEVADLCALAGLDAANTLVLLDELIARGLLANRTPVSFRHPLLADLVLARVPAGTRAALHLRAAEVLRGARRDTVRVARHLMAAGPLGASWAVRHLELAARRLAAEGRTEEAARMLRGALRQQVRPRARAGLCHELAKLDEFLDPERAARVLNAARQEAEDPANATDHALALATLFTEHGRPADAIAVLDDAAERLGGSVHAQHHRLRVHRTLVRLDGPPWLAEGMERPEVLTADADDHRCAARSLALLRAVHATNTSADRAAAVHNARQALAGPHRVGRPLWHAGSTLIAADELAEAWTHCGRVRLAGPHPPGQWDHVAADALRAVVCRVRGDLRGTEDALGPHVDLLCTAARRGHLLAARAVAILVEARARRADAESGLSLLADCGLDHELPLRQDTPAVLAARSALREATGDLAAALDDCLAAGRLLAGSGIHNPALLPWRSRAALLLIGLGERHEADRLAAAELTDARRWGTARAVGTALHAVALSTEEPERATMLTETVAVLGRSPARLELAAARLDLGIALHDEGRALEADAQLDAALAIARACGALPLTQRIAIVRQEHAPAPDDGSVPAVLRGLTPQELRILRLAREGITNREIAGKLFLAVRTVEFHLSSAYRKLGISGRRQLAAFLPAS